MARDRLALALATGLVALAAGLSFGMMASRAASDRLFYVCAFAQAALSLVAGRLAGGTGARMALPVLIGGAILLRLWFVVQVPTLSGDVYRYIWDGRITNAGFNPYLHVPADIALVPLRDPAQYSLIDKRDYAVTIYPPVAEAFFAVVTRLSSAVWAMKLAMVLAEGVAVLALWCLLSRLDRPHGAVAIYLLHPAPIWEIAGNGHVDAAMMALLLAAFAWGGASWPYRSLLLATLGALVKPTAALGLPAFWRPVLVKRPLFVIAVVALCYLPFAGASTGVVGFLPHYAHEQGLDTGQGFFVLAALGRVGLLQPWMSPLYALLAGSVLLGLALWIRKDGADDLRAMLGGTALLLVAFLLILSPAFPWYALAAFPMTCLLGWWSPFALVTCGFLLYGFNPDAPPFFERWSLMMAISAVAALYDVWRIRGRETIP